ncbi:preprotein translocase subunit SecG [Lutimaribacter sp. EGI FJ00015]|uniref:Preprotein translocase subunit SecG n=1 Tax=Lutimaribacter degradans TaxID=2945989 RepID=A0ACC5ZU01_9RHOB|nr:preprotein translocase subunit SecG [Lutimaribacter sp. EGI FJ00013]MCM2561423.1 preprotein translocase subunit SecG [Lutimaribacter sp. EGI FJ00013]MCO0612867.1 preprotein translocase subunit SecG [Lutimaribacter sp. EGI FJ00015]MCO0635525.1 preprotein translocase subunit SecG [Lutimaribacter sp. EGI FJ00014]
MENVILIVHLLLALALIGIVLVQRSEGGGLGIGGGGGGTMSGRPPATPMGKVTWVLAIAFICTSMILTILAAQKSAGSSVLDRIGNQPAAEQSDDGDPVLPSAGDGLLPPSGDDSAPLVPRAD